VKLAKLAIKRPTFIIALVLTSILLGLVSLKQLPVSLFPNTSLPSVVITTIYPGANVNEVEKNLTKPLEDAVNVISGLEVLRSISQDNLSILILSFKSSINNDVAIQEIRNSIRIIQDSLPKNIKEPIISKTDFNSKPFIVLNLKSKILNFNQLYEFAIDIVTKDLEVVQGVASVQVFGGQKKEIIVEPDKNKLKERGLFLTALAQRIQANTIDIPAGNITIHKENNNEEEVSVATIGTFQYLSQIENSVVNFIGNDVPVLVKDVARVYKSFDDPNTITRIDTKENDKISYQPSILIDIFGQYMGNIVAASKHIKDKVKELNEKYKNYHGSPELIVLDDASRVVHQNINDIQHTILEGLFLTILVVYLFLGNLRSTLITTLALPNSLIGTFIFMYIFGLSINIISLMSLSLAIGFLIDDAIVVRENIFRHYQKGATPINAALDGTKEVTPAVISTTLVTIAVFLPLAFTSGFYRQFYKEFSLTIIFALIISSLDALTMAPMLSVYIIPDHNENKKMNSKILEILKWIFNSWFNYIFYLIEKLYKKFICFILKNNFINIRFYKNKHFIISLKFIVIFFTGFLFFISILIAIKQLKMTFLPQLETGEFKVSIKAKREISLHEMDKITRKVEELIMSNPNVNLAYSIVGSNSRFSNFTNTSLVTVKLNKNNSINKKTFKTINNFKVINDLRETLNNTFGNNLEFSFDQKPYDTTISFGITNADISTLKEFSNKLINNIKNIPHLYDVYSPYSSEKTEIQIKFDHKKAKIFGVNSILVGSEIKAIVNGIWAGKYKENSNKYDIKVKLPLKERNILQNFNNIYVNNINNTLIKLSDISQIKEHSTTTQVYRQERQQYLVIEANTDENISLQEVEKQILKIFNEEKSKPENLKKYKDINLVFSGDIKNMYEMLKSILIASIFSIIFTFMVLASLYESIITPFTIMTALPLAIIGGFFALLMARQPIDMFTLIGMIMLLGIVAKNSILLIDYIQQQMRNSLDIDDAIIKACVTRLRPILMTSVTIIAAMIPTALGLSQEGKFRKGMGIVVIGGVISSTILTLIVVPAIFEYIFILRHFFRKIFRRPEKRFIDYTAEQQKAKRL
jgi:multidrug efflux pump subunit AcrB